MKYPKIYSDIEDIINNVDAVKTKISKEKLMKNKMLYSPKNMNDQFKKLFVAKGYSEIRHKDKLFIDKNTTINPFMQVDFSKDKVNIEVQLGKYAFMFYDMYKFQHAYINNNIEVGIEILPTHKLSKDMSSGVAYGEKLIDYIKKMNGVYPTVPVHIILISP